MRSLATVTLSALLAALLAAGDGRAQSSLPGLSKDDLGKLTDALRGEPEHPMKVRLQAALILGRVGGAEGVGPLGECLAEDSEYAVRAACALALGNIGDLHGVEPLVLQLDDPEPLVRDESRRSLMKLARPEALPYLVAARERGSTRVRMALVEIVALISSPEAGVLVSELLGDSDERVRAQAEAVLTGFDRAAAAALLVRALEHPNYRVRAQAAKLLGERKFTDAVDRLVELASSPLEAVEVQSAARGAMRQMRGSLDVAKLAGQARDPAGDRQQRLRAMMLLSAAGGPDALQACLDVLTADVEESMRGIASQALGELGDPRALPAMREALVKAENGRISRVIALSIKKIERSNSQ